MLRIRHRLLAMVLSGIFSRRVKQHFFANRYGTLHILPDTGQGFVDHTVKTGSTPVF
ncbi:MAG: hypothetical protein JW904_14305 [Spirochaetales bacterium]|nr:hypothetical protein [Spirochaetales bacterium]